MNLPRVARWIVAAFAPADWRESLLGDLEEERARRIARGRTAGSLWAGAAALSAALHLRRARRQESRRMTTLQPSLLTSVAGALRDAARAVMRRPRRSVIAALTLTLGLAAVTMAFSLANWLLYRPVPGVGSPDEVVTIKLDLELRGRPGMLPISVPVWRELARLPTLAALGGAADASFHVAVDAAPAERVRGAVATTNYFEVLRHRLDRGRAFGPDHDDPGRAQVAVVSQHFRRQVLGDEADPIGRTIRLNGHAFTVIGVAADGFRGPDRAGQTDLWVPLASHLASLPQYPRDLLAGSRGLFFSLVGRLAPGASLAQINADARALRDRLAAANAQGADFGEHSFTARPGIDVPFWQREQLPGMMTFVLAAASMLFLLACANAANLLFAGAIERRGEAATRHALGASRGRLAAQFLLEGLLLALASGGLALALTALGGRLLGGLVVAEFLPPLTAVPVDGRVFIAGLLGALSACVFASLAPALISSRVAPVAAGRGVTRGNRRLRHLLTFAQVAVAVALLSVAAVLVRSLQARYDVPLGFEPDDVLTLSLEPGVQGLDDGAIAALFGRVLEDVRSTAGVNRASLAWVAPFQLFGSNRRLRPADRPDQKTTSAEANYVSSEYFRTLGTAIVSGRDFTDVEGLPAGGSRSEAVILNESAARALFADADPIGRQVTDTSEKGRVFRVVGVVADMHTRGIDGRPASPAIFAPFEVPWGSLVVKLGAPAATVLPRIREVVRAIDPDLPVYDVSLLSDARDRHLAEPRLIARFAATVAGLSVMVASLGLYGALLRNVEERRREFGIRVALGAAPRQVAALVSLEAVVVAGAGAAVGLAAAIAVSRLIEARLFGVSAVDPASLAVACAFVIAMTAASSLAPARRAAGLDVVSELKAGE